jgi:hypothetical protein
LERLARNFDLIFSTLRLERDYVDAADRRLTQLTGCRRARKGVQCLFLALFCRANRAERCPVSGVKQPCRRNPETAEVDPERSLSRSFDRTAK